MPRRGHHVAHCVSQLPRLRRRLPGHPALRRHSGPLRPHVPGAALRPGLPAPARRPLHRHGGRRAPRRSLYRHDRARRAPRRHRMAGRGRHPRRRMPCASARAGRSPLTETDGIAKPMRRLRQLRIRLYECGE